VFTMYLEVFSETCQHETLTNINRAAWGTWNRGTRILLLLFWKHKKSI